MKNRGSVCVFVLAVIVIGSVWAEMKPEEYFLRYGYLKAKSGNNRAEIPTPEEMEEAILKFQRFAGLPQTGRMDETTKGKMISPRCGVKDLNGELAEYRAKTKWPKNLITWKIRKYSQSSQLSQAQQKLAIRKGLHRWASVSPLVFKETKDKPTLDISFERWHHGDGMSFDGRGKVLAHAFYPQNGDTHFDDDEIWVNGNTGGKDLETVAAHEFGHALGLGHSSNQRSLMAPFYQTFPDGFTLHWDDVAGIQRLYGKKPIGVTSSTTEITPTTDRDGILTSTPPPTGDGFCSFTYKQINAAMRISEHDFVFVDNGEVIDGRNGQKVAIQHLFPGGPSLVHAAVYSKQYSKAYLFKDEQVWVYTLGNNGQFSLLDNFPRRLADSRINKPESAIHFSYYFERIFLLKDGYFFEFSPYFDDVISGSRLKTSYAFTDAPSKVDATISSDSNVYFIVNQKAYKMPMNTRKVSRRGRPATLSFNKCRN